MKQILILGAGKSATALIRYLLEKAPVYGWQINVGDKNIALAEAKIANHPNGKAIYFDVADENIRKNALQNVDIVASLLPVSLHYLVAQDCAKLGKNMITASYLSAAERALAPTFEANNAFLLAEMGLDPGIDHLSLLQTLAKLRSEGAKIQSINSWCGALIAPESDNNPWHYKFTWAPMNVVLAGQGGMAQYLANGKPQYLPYHRLFAQPQPIEVPNAGSFEGYPNRDSLSYINAYQIYEIPNFLRGTLRRQGYCKAWNCLVYLGMTDNTTSLPDTPNLTLAEFTSGFLPANIRKNSNSLKEATANYLGLPISDPIIDQIAWLGLFDNTPIGLPTATPAQVLEKILGEKWCFEPHDNDQIVMLHEFSGLTASGKNFTLKAALIQTGIDHELTAIAQTVGYPVAITIELVLTQNLQLSPGVHLPFAPHIYNPVLSKLAELGIIFNEYYNEYS